MCVAWDYMIQQFERFRLSDFGQCDLRHVLVFTCLFVYGSPDTQKFLSTCAVECRTSILILGMISIFWESIPHHSTSEPLG